ncbi:AMP-binding protein [Saccharomonospora sp. NPDC046836]|uniref:class I adenylate-forming enzyme family protein n=1 Tax=Saccharomonospora sp. NPDC046836 TaxID=3156921 RepID=UPI0033ED02C3
MTGDEVALPSLYPADRTASYLDTSVGELLRTVATEVPDRVALISVGPGEEPRSWTYSELFDDARRAAHWLLDRFEPGDHLTVWAPNLPEWIILQHGAALAGLVLVTANPALRGAELEYLLKQSDSVGVAYAEQFRGTDMAALIAEVLPHVPAVREHIRLQGWLDEIRRRPAPERALPEVSAEAPAQLQYTSGTTGFPKGALLSHRAMLTNADYVLTRGHVEAGVTWVSSMPLFHTAGCGTAGLGTLSRRGTLVLCVLFDPDLMLASVERYAGDVFGAVPAMLRALLARQDTQPRDLSSLKLVMSGGDTVPPELVVACEERMGAGFSTVYGQTELSPIVAQTNPDDTVEDKCHTVGRPLPNVDVSVRSPQDGSVVGRGEIGEICARGYQVMLGYHRMPDETRSTVDKDGWLHTGDLGVMDERGYLRVTGRLKDMIIRGGENIYPREIEAVLGRHPAVASIVVLGIPDEQWGETVAAVLSLEPGSDVTAEELHDFVRGQLAPHKTPKDWYLTDTLPTNAMGKLQKFRLRELIEASALTRLPSREQ